MSLSASTSTLPTSIPPPPEIEATLSRLSAYRNVKGVMILSRSVLSTTHLTENGSSGASTSSSAGRGGIVQSTGSVFEGEGGKKYAQAVEDVVARVSKAVGEVDEGVSHACRGVLRYSLTVSRMSSSSCGYERSDTSSSSHQVCALGGIAPLLTRTRREVPTGSITRSWSIRGFYPYLVCMYLDHTRAVAKVTCT